jgi:hypothetical protein
MRAIYIAIVTVCAMAQSSFAATTLPFGPYGFDSFAGFDSTFKQGAGSVQRDSGGFVYIRSGSSGSAVFDTSALSGPFGNGGSGGSTGSDANNDLSDFTISADIAGSISSLSLMGFYLRLDGGEANGYLASVQFLSPTQIAFSLSEGASVSSDGSAIFSQSLQLRGLTLAAGSYYSFNVSANGGQFDFDFGNGAGTATFTDSSISRTVGQVGFLLRNPQVQLDNFSVVPEPGASSLLSLGACSFLLSWRYGKSGRKSDRAKSRSEQSGRRTKSVQRTAACAFSFVSH